MVGTGVFAVWEPALDRAGEWLVVAVGIAAIVAALNATSTARLASRFPEAGGVYAYGRIQLNRFAGVAAGVVFIIGKTASASAAALTIGLYVWPDNSRVVAAGAIALVLALNLRGIVRSTRVAAVMVSVVAGVLVVFVITSASALVDRAAASSTALSSSDPIGVLAAAALAFVAFAGYARITVLGEEVKEPHRTIPRAIAWSFAFVVTGYVVIALVVLFAARSDVAIGSAALLDIAQALAPSWLLPTLVVCAVLAAGAVLLSLVAGVGRTLFAMASRGDAPRFFAAVGHRSRIPVRAEIAAATGSAVLVLVGGLTLALAVSAAMILTYYAIAHISAMRLSPAPASRLLRLTPLVGLAGCALLVGALIVETAVQG